MRGIKVVLLLTLSAFWLGVVAPAAHATTTPAPTITAVKMTAHVSQTRPGTFTVTATFKNATECVFDPQFALVGVAKNSVVKKPCNGVVTVRMPVSSIILPVTYTLTIEAFGAKTTLFKHYALTQKTYNA